MMRKEMDLQVEAVTEPITHFDIITAQGERMPEYYISTDCPHTAVAAATEPGHPLTDPLAVDPDRAIKIIALVGKGRTRRHEITGKWYVPRPGPVILFRAALTDSMDIERFDPRRTKLPSYWHDNLDSEIDDYSEIDNYPVP